MKLNWSELHTDDDTHYCADGVMGFYTSAPGLTDRQVAQAFADTYTYDDGEPGYVVAKICRAMWGDATPLIAYFAFDGQDSFEWHTDRMGGARGH